MSDDVRMGQQRAARMRRIGDRHMVVLPAQTAAVISVADVERALAQARQQARQALVTLRRQQAIITDLEAQLARFRALPVERCEDDPDVPQPAEPTPIARGA